MPHTTEDPELGEVKKDPRDTLIEAQRKYIEFLKEHFGDTMYEAPKEYIAKEELKQEQLETRIQAAEKAIKGG